MGFNSQLEPVLQFLSNVPGPSGNSALAKLLQHGVTTNDSRLGEMVVAGDMIHSEGRVTRSARRNNPQQWTQVPLLAKLLKLLINEIENLIEENNDDAESEEDGEDDWDNEDSQESDSSSTNNREIDLSQLLAPAEDYL